MFPLLIVAVSVITIITKHNEHLRTSLLANVNHYFPIVGNQLQSTVHSSSKTGLALVIGLAITLWGAKGITDAIQHALNHIWQVPRPNRPSFPTAPLKSLAIIIGGGSGMLAATTLSSYATTLGHSPFYLLVSIIISMLVLFCTFSFVFSFGNASKHNWHDNRASAITATIGFQILQTFGGYLITHQLKNLTGAYGQFGFVLAILFWFYLQAQVFMYAAEVSTVRALKLWPRSLAPPLSAGDQKAYTLYAKKETYRPVPTEEVSVAFDKPAAK